MSRSATTDALRQSPPPRKKKTKKKKTGDFRLLSSPSILISTLCDSLGFPGILGDTQLRRRLPIKEGGGDEGRDIAEGDGRQNVRRGRETRLVKEEKG